jgi:hypothetical protein
MRTHRAQPIVQRWQAACFFAISSKILHPPTGVQASSLEPKAQFFTGISLIARRHDHRQIRFRIPDLPANVLLYRNSVFAPVR